MTDLDEIEGIVRRAAEGSTIDRDEYLGDEIIALSRLVIAILDDLRGVPIEVDS